MVRIELAAQLRRAVDDPDVEDAVQEVLLECLKAGGALERASEAKCTRFRAYLGGITRNVGLRHLRVRKNQPSALEETEFVSDSSPDVEANLNAAWSQAVLGEAMALLVRESCLAETARLRLRVLQLRHQEGLKAAQVAEMLGISATRVHHLTSEAKNEYRLALLSVVSQQNPGLGRAEIEAECVALLQASDACSPSIVIE